MKLVFALLVGLIMAASVQAQHHRHPPVIVVPAQGPHWVSPYPYHPYHHYRPYRNRPYWEYYHWYYVPGIRYYVIPVIPNVTFYYDDDGVQYGSFPVQSSQTPEAKSEASVNKVDWKVLWKEAKKGTVRLMVEGVSTPNKENFSVFFVDATEIRVASSAFYVQSPANFVYDISSTLRQFKAPPSENAKIVLRGDKGVEVKFSGMTISLPK